MLLSRSAKKATSTPNRCRMSNQTFCSVKIERGCHEPLSRIVPHNDENLVLGYGFLVFLVQHLLRLFAEPDLVLLVGIRLELPALEVEENDRPLVLNFFVEVDDLVRVVLYSLDQIGVGAPLPFRPRHRHLLDLLLHQPPSSSSSSSSSSKSLD